MKAFLLFALVGCLLSELSHAGNIPKATVRSDVYGTWSPPPELLGFWKGMDERWWYPDPQPKKLLAYLKAYAATHDARATIPKIIEDMKQGEDQETKPAAYEALLACWNRKQVKEILGRYAAMPTASLEHAIAEDFIGDLEEYEVAAKSSESSKR
jgi:hypothetical protein